ncbi:MAG: IS110 family RNA-guided transposase [Gemmatimonadaceae bacterium]
MSSATTIYLGLDVHKESVTIAVLPSGALAPTRVDTLPNDLAKRRRFCERQAGAGTVRACYEASGAGYVIQRAMTAWGVHCDVIAPSLIPTKPGQQRKHDSYDAVQLARLYRAGELTVVRIPTEAEERVRDVVRCRETLQREVLRSRHYILKFLARRGFVYREGTPWRQAHYNWLRRLAAESSPLAAEDRQVFGEYLGLLEYKLSRRDALDEQIEALAFTPALATAVATLQCFRGIQQRAAMVLATEISDWQRFGSPRQLMAYLGLVPREHSSGDRERRGSITKAGNTHCRHVLVQAAWAYRFQPKIGVALKARQRGQSPVVIAHAWKAQHRLHTFYQRLAFRRRPQIAVVAVARELVGFLWAVMRDVTPDEPITA